MEGGRIPDAAIKKDQVIIYKKQMCEVAEFIHSHSFESVIPFCGGDKPTESFNH